MKFVFLPFSIVTGLVAGQLAKKLFEFVWGRVADEEAPEPEHKRIPLVQLALALAIEGAIARLVRGLVDHGSRHLWENVMGEWPGDEEPDPE